ncbi:MAG: UDP-3-O-(3-hydroxymyristoyl)glucosamine N-acyltransferase [Bdellovibrionales bacterium]|nr:UDP-3-O-(3-hydroxymyristoyl)glucosamine N-acyltransferase [Bdellovibrionales bacterium]
MLRRLPNAQYALSEIAQKLGCTASQDPTILGVCSLDEPQSGHIAFSTSTEWAQIEKQEALNTIAALIVSEKLPDTPEGFPLPVLRVANPLFAMTQVIPLFFVSHEIPTGIHPQASVSPSATIAADATIGPFCSVGDDATICSKAVLHPHVTIYPGATVGERTVVHSGAIIREDCVVGSDALIQNGAIIGAEGFGYMPDPNIGIRQVPQVGTTILGDRVDIGANTCVDRAALGTTQIGAGTKLDNLVQVGHNVHVGTHSLLCSLVGIAGSSRIGSRVTLGGAVGVADHVSVCDDTRFAGRSAITSNITEKGDYAGFPAIPVSQWRRQLASINRLPKILKEWKNARSKS